MLLAFITTVLALAAVGNAAAASLKPAPAMRVHEHRAHAPTGFVAVGKAHADTPLKIRLGLKQRNIDGLIEALYRVSDPAGADYGKYLTKEEAAAFMAPTPDTLTAVTDWLAENDIEAKSISPAGEWLEFTVSTSKANALFDADFTTFKHTDSGTQGIRTLKYSVPTILQAKIEAMLPGILFWTPSKGPKFSEIKVANTTRGGAAEKRQLPPCNQLITPTCLQQFYGIPATPATQTSSTLAVSGFLEQYANQADLATFLQTVRPEIANNTFSTLFLDGGSNPQDILEAGVEANLDVQYTVGIATGVLVTFVSVGEDTQDEVSGFLDIINFLSSLDNPPNVLTTSYGANEGFASPSVANMLCNAYASFGAQGASLIFSSGDGGVSGSQPTTFCTTGFIPTFPSNCPFVTSVGATTGVPPESAADLSSGGFSNIFSTASYQSAAVSNYLAQIGGLYAGQFNPNGRAFPDVAVAGTNYVIAFQDQFVGVDGTSASAPVFASIIALINDRLAAAGRPSLGFLNPFLYANPQAFSDITAGSNPGCGTNGFPALSGWDPVTGLGTPNFAALAAAAGV